MQRRDFLSALGGVAIGGGLGSTRSQAEKLFIRQGGGGPAGDASGMEARFGRKAPVRGEAGLVITTHPLASKAAVDVLREGGSACDAALCAALTQTVVEPHMTTVTGMLSLLYYDARTKKFSYINGTVNRPRATLEGFSRNDVSGGRAVAVPGFWAAVEEAHRRFCRQPMKRLMAPAIDLAENGFEIHPFLWGEMFSRVHLACRDKQGQEIFMPGGELLHPGDIVYQKRAADTLRQLSEEGAGFFYHGRFAQDICRQAKQAGGVITPEDFAEYKVRVQAPSRGSYRGYDVIASPAPDNGGMHLIEILNMVELLEVAKLGGVQNSDELLYWIIRICDEVVKAGAEQRDPEFYPLPIERILSKDYARQRFSQLKMGVSLSDESLQTVAPPGSNHLTVVDKDGNIATLMHSCMSYPWSNGLYAGGVSICAAGVHFLRVMPPPGGRVSGYLCPHMIFRNGAPVLAGGSPSVSLIQNIVQNTMNILDLGISLTNSVHSPRFGGPSSNNRGRLLIESDLSPEAHDGLRERGLSLDVVNPWNWTHGSYDSILFHNQGVAEACGDPRRTAFPMAV